MKNLIEKIAFQEYLKFYLINDGRMPTKEEEEEILMKITIKYLIALKMPKKPLENTKRKEF